MKIKSVEIIPITIPFRNDFYSLSVGTALGRWEVCEFVLVKLHTDEGITGCGEVPPWIRVGKESQAGIVGTIQNYLAQELIGQDPFDTEKIWQTMDLAAPENTMAKTAIDLALYDVMGKALNVPLSKLIGGRVRDKIPLTGIVGLGSLKDMMLATEYWLENGYKTIRLKIGMGREKDRELLKIGRETVGSDVKLRVDANQAYRPKQAVQVIKAIEEFDIEFVEQPIAAWDFEGLVYVRNHVDTPIMPHESLYDIQDAKRLIAMGAVDLLGLKLDRPGGLTNARLAYKMAELFDIPCTVISSVELGISTSAAMMFAASLKTFEYAGEASGMMTISDDVVREPLVIKDGFAEVPTGVGLGAELDEQKVEKYSEGAITCS